MPAKNERRIYLIVAFSLTAVELLIAFFAKDGFIRPYLGDFLVVIFLYCWVRGLTDLTISTALIGILLLSYTIEFLQWIHLIDRLHLSENRAAGLILGTCFSVSDIVCYTLGIIFCAIAERFIAQKKPTYRNS